MSEYTSLYSNIYIYTSHVCEVGWGIIPYKMYHY